MDKHLIYILVLRVIFISYIYGFIKLVYSFVIKQLDWNMSLGVTLTSTVEGPNL